MAHPVMSGVLISNLKLLQSFSIRKHSIQSATKVSDEKLYHMSEYRNNKKLILKLYCALDTKSINTLKGNNCEKKRTQPLRNSKS